MAQQAVVNAVAQAQLIYSTKSLAGTQPKSTLKPRSEYRPLLKRPSVLFAAAAALIILVASWGYLTPGDSPTPEVATVVDDEELAVAWADTFAVEEQDQDPENYPLSLESIADELFGEVSENEFVDASAELDEPEEEGWMFIALSELDSMEAME